MTLTEAEFLRVAERRARVRRTDGRKKSIYLPTKILAEVRTESLRLDRSMSAIIQVAWDIARDQIRALPGRPRR